MTRITRFVLIALVCLLFAVALPALAQEATPEAVGYGNITIEDGGSLTLVQDAPLSPASEAPAALAVLLTMATSVAGFVELVKPGLAKQKVDRGWSDELHTFVVRLVAFGAALVLIFFTVNDANVIVAWGLTLALPAWLVKVATAFVISFGSAFVWAGFRFLKFMPILAAMVPAATVPVVPISDPVRTQPPDVHGL